MPSSFICSSICSGSFPGAPPVSPAPGAAVWVKHTRTRQSWSCGSPEAAEGFAAHLPTRRQDAVWACKGVAVWDSCLEVLGDLSWPSGVGGIGAGSDFRGKTCTGQRRHAKKRAWLEQRGGRWRTVGRGGQDRTGLGQLGSWGGGFCAPCLVGDCCCPELGLL